MFIFKNYIRLSIDAPKSIQYTFRSNGNGMTTNNFDIGMNSVELHENLLLNNQNFKKKSYQKSYYLC